MPIVEKLEYAKTYRYACAPQYPSRDAGLTGFVYAFNAVLLIANGLLAWKTRNAPDEYGEAKQMGYTV